MLYFFAIRITARTSFTPPSRVASISLIVTRLLSNSLKPSTGRPASPQAVYSPLPTSTRLRPTTATTTLRSQPTQGTLRLPESTLATVTTSRSAQQVTLLTMESFRPGSRLTYSHLRPVVRSRLIRPPRTSRRPPPRQPAESTSIKPDQLHSPPSVPTTVRSRSMLKVPWSQQVFRRPTPTVTPMTSS